jgi:hypothetical protein
VIEMPSGGQLKFADILKHALEIGLRRDAHGSIRIQKRQPNLFLPSSWAVILPELFDTFAACNRLSLSGTAKRASIEAPIRSNVSICCFGAHSLR